MGSSASKNRPDGNYYFTYMICVNDRPWVIHFRPTMIPSSLHEFPKKLFGKLSKISDDPIVLAIILQNLSADPRFPLDRVYSMRKSELAGIYTIKYRKPLPAIVQIGAIRVNSVV